MELYGIDDVVIERTAVAEGELAAAVGCVRCGHGCRGGDRHVRGERSKAEKIFSTSDGARGDGDSSNPQAGVNLVGLEYEAARGCRSERSRILLLAETRRRREEGLLNHVEVAIVDHGDRILGCSVEVANYKYCSIAPHAIGAGKRT